MWQKEKRNVVVVGVLKDVFQPFNVLSKNFQNSLVDAPSKKYFVYVFGKTELVEHTKMCYNLLLSRYLKGNY